MRLQPRVTRFALASAFALMLFAPRLAAAQVAPVVYTDYTFANPGPYFNFDMYTSWTNAPASGYNFPAFQFWFQANQGGYMGTQLVGTTKKAIFSIWDIALNSAEADPAAPWCVRFGGEGTGMQCLIDYNWVAGHEYQLRLWTLGTTPTGERWGAWITDTVTQVSTQIGIIHLKHSNGFSGYGWLLGQGPLGTFLEYFVGAPTCAQNPVSAIRWRGPFGNNADHSVEDSVVSYGSGPCTNSNTFTFGYPTVVQQAGGTTTQTLPAGTVPWNTPATIAYGEGTVVTPRFRTWDGGTWSGESSAGSVGATTRWTMLRRDPLRTEAILGTLDSNRSMKFQVWNGTAWGNLVTAGTSSLNTSRAFDIAYNNVGNALVVYNDGTNTPKYRTWNGTVWSAAAAVPVTQALGAPRWIRLETYPNSSLIVVAYQDSANRLTALVWTGSGWISEQVLSTAVGVSTAVAQSFDVAFERGAGGRAMVVWAQTGSSVPRYRTWNGSWSAENAFGNPEQMSLSSANNLYFVRLVADPSSNQLALATVDVNFDLYAQVWSGTAWGAGTRSSTVLNTSLEFRQTERQFDLAFHRNGTLLAAYDTSTANSVGLYRTWTVAGGWTAAQNLPAGAVDPAWVQVKADPYSEDIFVGLLDKQADVNLHRWNGVIWGPSIEVETTAAGSSYTYESFTLSYLP